MGSALSEIFRWRTLAAVLVAGCAVAAAAQPADSPGAPPRRIVSLLPSATEAVCALGACDRLVGVDVFSQDPPAVRHLPQLGRTWQPDIERIVQLKPDLVLVGNVPPVQQRLEAAGLRVVVADAATVEDVHTMLEQLDAVLQPCTAPARATALWQHLQVRLQEVAAGAQLARQGRAAPRVYLEVDAALFAAAPGSFMGQVLAQLGADNIVAAGGRPFPQLSPEFVLRADPDLIIQTHSAAVRDLAQRPGWAALRAVRTGQVCRLSPSETRAVNRPGPRLDIAAGVLARCLRAPAGTVSYASPESPP